MADMLWPHHTHLQGLLVGAAHVAGLAGGRRLQRLQVIATSRGEALAEHGLAALLGQNFAPAEIRVRVVAVSE